MIKLILIILFLILIPIILGMGISSVITDKKGLYKISFSYVTGLLFVLALFEVVSVPMIYIGFKLSDITIVMTVVLITLSLYIIIKNNRGIYCGFKSANQILRYERKKINIFEFVYALAFFALLFIQIYYAIRYSSTHNSFDDASYIVYGTDALQGTAIYGINPYIGVYMPEPLHRVLQSSNIFYAYISSVTGASVPAVAHTAMNAVLLIVSYCVYYMVAVDLLKKDDSNYENVWLFMMLIAILYIFGYYSHYSLSFRLLGVLWQGKAVLAVTVTPLIFVLMKDFLTKEYKHRYGLYLLMVSIASISLSLMAASHILLGIGLTTLIVTCINKKWKNLLYILWACIVPGIIGAVYLIERIMTL